MTHTILSDYRRHIGDFDAVDFVDEEKVEEIRRRPSCARPVFPTPYRA